MFLCLYTVGIKGTFGIGDRVCCAGLADSHEARVEGVESLWPVERDKKNLLAFLPFHENVFVRHRVRRHESPLYCRGSKRSARSGNGALAMERMRCAGFSGPQVLYSTGGSCHQDGAFLQFPLANHMGKRYKNWLGRKLNLSRMAGSKAMGRRDSGGLLPHYGRLQLGEELTVSFVLLVNVVTVRRVAGTRCRVIEAAENKREPGNGGHLQLFRGRRRDRRDTPHAIRGRRMPRREECSDEGR